MRQSSNTIRSRREAIRSSTIVLMGKTLNAAFEQPERILNERDGEMAECPFCELVLKLCRRSPGAVCGRVRKSGTLLAGYEAVIRRLDEESFGVCVKCGRSIGAAVLACDPLTELCPECGGRSAGRGKRGGKHARSKTS